MDDQYFVLDLAIARRADSYQIELSHSDPTSDVRVAPVRADARFDLESLVALQSVSADYGKALAAQVFADSSLRQRFLQVQTIAEAADKVMRLSLRIDPSAQELHSLRWELLQHPETGASLSTSETVLFSRFMVSRDFRPVKLRGRSELSALLVVAAPAGPMWQKLELAQVDHAGETERVQRVMSGIHVRVMGGAEGPVTLDRLLAELRTGVDILYLVGHGMFGRSTGTPALVLQDDSGDAAIVKGDDLAVRIGELQKGPRLVVLASCQSAGDGDRVHSDRGTSVQATLAGRLADAGVPAIIAMQGQISMATVEAMMPVFFQQLLDHGQVDRAIGVARGRVRDRPDFWMPALFTRLNSCELWYTPGFRGADGDSVWKKLVKPVRHKKLVPILGPGLLTGVYGTTFEVAKTLAEAHRFPLSAHECDDLPRVTQFLTVKESRFNVVRLVQEQLQERLVAHHKSWLPQEELDKKPKLGKLLALVADHLREQKDGDVFGMLADLPASTYVNLTMDPLLSRALKEKQRKPQILVSRWRYKKSPAPVEPGEVEASQSAPVVFHAFGAFGNETDDTLVLTEDDYFDYLIGTAADKLIPPQVESALVDNSLLFLGFRLTDWSFRVLFRLMRSLPGRDRLKNYCHVAVQLDPELHTMADVEGAKAYLKKYFHNEAQIEIYWGTPEEFLSALQREVDNAGGVIEEAPAEEAGDEFDF